MLPPLRNFFDENGIKAGLIGTCGIEIADEKWKGEISTSTTPEAFELFEIFKEMVDKGCEYAVMEVSSQGLDQKRVAGCVYEVGIFTNLTQDHLDVHKTMENYYQAKKKLFEISKTGVINIDDEYGKRLVGEVKCKIITFSDRGQSRLLRRRHCSFGIGLRLLYQQSWAKAQGAFSYAGGI